MSTRSILCISAALAIAGCAVAQEQAETQSTFDGDVPSSACIDGNNETECVIELRVTDKEADSCLIELIVPSHDLVTFNQRFKDKFVFWRITEQPGVTKKYRFGLHDGISFVDNPRPRTFVSLQRGAKEPTSFRGKNKHTRRSVFKYVINVTNETETAPPTRECSLDPWFRNR